MVRPPEALDISSHIERFLKKQMAKSQNTYQARRGDLRDFDSWLTEQGYAVEDVTPWVLDDYFTYLMAQDYAPKTIKGRWDSVNQLYKFLSLRDVVAENPIQADEIQRQDYTDSKEREHAESTIERKYITKEEMEQLVAHVPTPKLRNKLLIRLMWQTGVRTNEVTRIRLDDLDREERSIEIYAKKTGDMRTVYYQESLDFLLKEWLDRGYRASCPYAEDSEYLFVTRVKEKLSDGSVNPIVRKAAERAGIQEELYTDKKGDTRVKITAHSLRHGHAVYSLRSGIDLRRIQKHMGHESLDMTTRYLDVIDEDVKEAYQRDFGTA